MWRELELELMNKEQFPFHVNLEIGCGIFFVMEVVAVPVPVRPGIGKGLHRVPSLINIKPLGVLSARSCVQSSMVHV